MIDFDNSFILEKDECGIIALGAFKIQKLPTMKYNIRVESLKKVVELLSKSQHEYIDISVYGEEFPIIFGNGTNGIIVAPRVPEEKRCPTYEKDDDDFDED